MPVYMIQAGGSVGCIRSHPMTTTYLAARIWSRIRRAIARTTQPEGDF
jgi:hypothetical protein